MVGSYSLGKLIGRGAMGEIYIAYHQATKEQAAVKLLMLDHAERETSIARFHREGAQLMKLDSPHIVRVFDYGDLEGFSLISLWSILEAEILPPSSGTLRSYVLSKL